MVGGSIAWISGKRVAMTDMPQMIALYNGMGGGAAAAIAAVQLYRGSEHSVTHLTIALIGTGLGDLLAFGLCYAQQQFRFLSLPSDIYFMTSVPILLRPEYFAIVSVLTIGLCILSSLLPARLASRLNPVTAIRFS